MTNTSQFNTKSPTIRRILREAAELSNSPSPDYTAEPLEADLFEWHFTMKGPPNSAYSEGLYHGRIVLPSSYPLRPPSFRFTTPNGRFETNREICLSISGHHEETWQPAWGLRTAIVALRSFMETDAQGQLGGLDTPDAVRRRFAKESGSFVCPTCGKSNLAIIRESEERFKDSSVSSEDHEVAVPKELKMGWRDEMEKKRPVQDTANRNEVGDVEENGEAQLAEGFVQTAPPPVAAQHLNTSGTASSVAGHGPTESIRGSASAAQQPLRPLPVNITQRRPLEDDGVPLWLDRAIVGLVLALVAVLLKVLFGA